MKHWTDEELVLYYYQELDETNKRELSDALAKSEHLQARLDAISGLLDETLSRDIPRPDRHFNQRIMAGIYREHNKSKQAKTAPLRTHWLHKVTIGLQSMALGKAFASVLLVVIATATVFSLGRWSAEPGFNSKQNPIVHSSDQLDTQASQRVLYAGMLAHMEHSQRLLTRVSNADPDLQNNNADRAQVMDELIGFNRLYRRLAEQAGDYPLARVLEQNEALLIELNNMAPDSGDRSWRALEQRVEQSDLVFKLKVANRRLTQQL